MDLKLLGVVMAGGKSSRMGRDKGLSLFQGRPMAVRVRDLLEESGLSVLVSVNEDQLPSYAQLFPVDTLVVDRVPEMGGPLRGILSVHVAFPGSDLIVVACDMPLLGSSVIRRLVDEHIGVRDEPGVPFVAFDSDGIQPLCALYPAGTLARLMGQVRSGRLPPSCPRKLMATTPGTRLLAPRDGQEQLQFTNVNRPEELAAARAAHAAGQTG